MRRLLAWTCLVALAGAMPAAELQIPAALRPIADLAGSAPPEFGADALLRLAASREVRDRPTQAALIEQAFEMAARAHEAVPRVAVAGANVDTEAGMRAQGYALGLDTVSLQSRAVLTILRLDAGRARRMMEDARRPALQPLACADALTYDVSRFYESLTAVLNQAFPAAERAKEEHVRFALEFLAGVTSPAQLAPALRMIADASTFTPAQRDVLEAQAGALMGSVDADSRSFLAAQSDIAAALPASLQAAFAKLKQRMAQGTVCAAPQAGKIVTVTPASPDAAGAMPEPGPLWSSAGAKAMLAAARDVRYPGGLVSSRPPQGATADWQGQFVELLGQLAAWQPDGEESAAQFYHEKCTLYEGLVDVAPTEALRVRLLDDFLAFVTSSGVASDSPEEWFFHVPAMVKRIPYADAAEASNALEQVARTGDAALTLYATLEKLLPSSPGAKR